MPTRVVLYSFVLALSLAGCSSNVVLRRDPGTFTGELGPMIRCEAGQEACKADRVFDSSRFNAAHTTFLRLPHCEYGYQQILIEDSGSSEAHAIVQCAAAPPAPRLAGAGGIPTTETGGGVSAAP
jgi:hypothetical protein